MLISLGLAFIYSKELKDISIIERTLYWISQNVTVPRTRYNHILDGLFFLMVGMLSFLLPPGREENEASRLLWTSLKKDPSFWMSMLFILIFNLLIGVYRSKRKGKG
jgi:hypothetical protein